MFLFRSRFLLCAALLGLGAAPAAVAQTPTLADTAAARSEWGLTASPQLAGFFTANRSLPLGLLYKRQLSPTKALRLRLVGMYSRRDTTNYLVYAPSNTIVGYVEGPNTSLWELTAYAGYEWQRALGKRFYYSYGLEAGVGWNRLRSEYLLQFYEPNQAQLGTETGTTTINTLNVHSRPFAGIHYHVANTLDLFIESAVALTYSHRQHNIVTHQVYFNGTGDGERNNKSNSFSVLWRPVQFIGVTVKF